MSPGFLRKKHTLLWWVGVGGEGILYYFLERHFDAAQNMTHPKEKGFAQTVGKPGSGDKLGLGTNKKIWV